MAELARISASPMERERYARELTAVLEYVTRLQAVDTSGIDDGALFSETQAPDKDLSRTDPEIREQLVQGFPDRLADFLRVPSVFPRRSSNLS